VVIDQCSLLRWETRSIVYSSDRLVRNANSASVYATILLAHDVIVRAALTSFYKLLRQVTATVIGLTFLYIVLVVLIFRCIIIVNILTIKFFSTE